MIHTLLRLTLVITFSLLLCVCVTLVLGRGLRANAVEIAYLQAEGTDPTHGDLALMDLERRQTHSLVQGMQITDFDWSPNGQQIAFIAWNNSTQLHLYTLDLVTGSTRRVTERSIGSEDAPAWSPDGQRLAYLTMGEGTALEVIDFATGETRRLVTGDFVDRQLAWSPDSQRIAYVTGRLTARNVFIFDFDANRREQLTVGEGRINAVVWSPDGTMLNYVLRGVLYGLSPHGGTPQALTPDSAAIMGVNWSPDSTHIYYVGVHIDVVALYVISPFPSSRMRRTIKTMYSVQMPQPSPDGAQILIGIDRAYSMDLLLLQSDGSGAQHIGRHTRHEWLPAWRPPNAG